MKKIVCIQFLSLLLMVISCSNNDKYVGIWFLVDDATVSIEITKYNKNEFILKDADGKFYRYKVDSDRLRSGKDEIEYISNTGHLLITYPDNDNRYRCYEFHR